MTSLIFNNALIIMLERECGIMSYQLLSPWAQEKIDALNISYRLISFATYLMDPFHMNPELKKPGSEGIR